MDPYICTYPQGGFFVGGRIRRLEGGAGIVVVDEAILVHNPIGFHPFWGFAAVENQSFLHADLLVSVRGQNRLVRSGGFPIP